MDRNERIKLIMQDQHMTQQVFADFLQQAPATLSSIFNGRTRPTLNIMDAIKEKIPNINMDWLLYGSGEMYISHPDADSQAHSSPEAQDLVLNFEGTAQPASRPLPPSGGYATGGKPSYPEHAREEVRIIEREPRRVTEIRVYYDDQTYETFVPSKK